jgi:hypothetical protein
MQTALSLIIALAATSVANAAPTQTEADEYTRYELLAPETSSFKIYYEVTATTAGAKFFYNPIRKGSTASDEHVYDAMLGKPLHFEVVSGAEARKDPLMADAEAATDYIKVTLARPVPENGQGRLVILKTYRDEKSYHLDGTGSALVFDRPLGVKRNKVVLPLGYEVVGLTVPAQILTEKDGRIAASFLHAGSGEAPFVLRAIKDAQPATPKTPTDKRSWESPFKGETEEIGCPSGLIRTATLFTSCSSPKLTHSISITITRKPERA